LRKQWNNWAVEEDLYLKTFFASASRTEVLKTLKGRSWSSIKSRASSLKIPRRAGLIRLSVPDWSETETAYLAGLVDGEGCIQIRQVKQKPYMIWLVISNTDKAVMEWVESMFGAGLYVRLPQNVRWKTCYHVRVQGERACILLRRLVPFLRIKRQKAETAIKYWEWRRAESYNGPGEVPRQFATYGNPRGSIAKRELK
jgi:hypothetical protein